MTSAVTLEEAQRLIGTLPSLAPRPNATNIRNLEVALFDALEGIPSHQSPEYGYKGMAQQALEYALDVAVPWVDVANPGLTGLPMAPSTHGNSETRMPSLRLTQRYGSHKTMSSARVSAC